MRTIFKVAGICLVMSLCVLHSCEKGTNIEIEIDIDGNSYKTIRIGDQLWMVENIKTTKYNDGTSIPNVTDDSEWENMNSDAYCWYDNNASLYKSTYGALYNWYAVDTKKLCPIGWHIPSHAEWNTLVDYLGGEIKGNWNYSLVKS